MIPPQRAIDGGSHLLCWRSLDTKRSVEEVLKTIGLCSRLPNDVFIANEELPLRTLRVAEYL